MYTYRPQRELVFFDILSSKGDPNAAQQAARLSGSRPLVMVRAAESTPELGLDTCGLVALRSDLTSMSEGNPYLDEERLQSHCSD